MEKIIIGIHGLANKPERDTLENWWKKSIQEGLTKNLNIDSVDFDFEMVYWADLLYKNYQHNDTAFDFDNLYNNEPYIEAKEGELQEYKDGWPDKIKSKALDVIGSSLDAVKRNLELDFIADWVLSKVLKDLAFYYDDNRKISNGSGGMEVANRVLKNKLKKNLKKYKSYEIMLIAHSMGSIIAYDVLRDIGHNGSNEISIKHFVTIGSPLGLPHVKHKIIEQRTYNKSSNIVRTPSIVTGSWKNYADKKDRVAIDAHLSDDFGKNIKGIQVLDDLVLNDYEGLGGISNHHKSYGYLRTPELSKHIGAFLGLHPNQ